MVDDLVCVCERVSLVCCVGGGKKSSTEGDKSPAASDATTVPGTDEEARSMAIAKYKQSLAENNQAVTPEDKTKRMPATPSTSLPRASSVPILMDKAESAQQSTTEDNNSAKRNKNKVQPKKGAKKTQNRRAKKTKQVKKKNKQNNTKKIPQDTGPGTSPATPAATAHVTPTKPTVPSPMAPSEPTLPPSTPSTLATPSVQSPVVKQEPSQEVPPPSVPHETPRAPEQPAGTPAVHSIMNRAQTADLDALQKKAPEQTTASPTAETRVRVRNERDKFIHNRRQRFYRSLESFLAALLRLV